MKDINQFVEKAIDSLLESDDLASTLSNYILQKEEIGIFITEKMRAITSKAYEDECTKNPIYTIFLEKLRDKLRQSNKLSSDQTDVLIHMIELMKTCDENENKIQEVQDIQSAISDIESRIESTKQQQTDNRDLITKKYQESQDLARQQESWAFLGGIPFSVATACFIVIMLMALPHSAPLFIIIPAIVCFVTAIATWTRVATISSAATDNTNQSTAISVSLQRLNTLSQRLESDLAAKQKKATDLILTIKITSPKCLEPTQAQSLDLDTRLKECINETDKLKKQATEISKHLALKQATNTTPTSQTTESHDDKKYIGMDSSR